ncbi:hypothetical protein [Acinetobacter terrae]|nr:hypothetical protein [Acinetobacter terrae]
MILKVLASSIFCFTCSNAFSACTISDTGAGAIRLQPLSGSTSTIQLNIKCDSEFNIRFDSQNLVDSSGNSTLKNESALAYTKLKNSIDVKYELSGDAGSQWQLLKTQKKKAQHIYVIVARLGSVNLASLAAGDYRDRITITMDY